MRNTVSSSIFDPNRVLDQLILHLSLKSDAALAARLFVDAATISRIRHRRLAISGGFLLRMHEQSGLTIRVLRGLMGDRRRFFRGKERTLKISKTRLGTLNYDRINGCTLLLEAA